MVSKRERHLQWITSIHLEPPDKTMDKKLVINVAPTGAFIKRVQNPNQAYTGEEIARHVIESYKAGASMWHIHIRDKEGAPTEDVKDVLNALDMVLDQCPDILLSHTSHANPEFKGAEMLKPLVEPLLEAGAKKGRKYIHTVVIAPYARGYAMDEALLRDIITYLQSRGVRPEFQIHHYDCIRHVQEWLLKDGLLQRPYVMNLISGYHGPDYSGPTGPEPWGRLYLMSMMNVLPGECVIGATIGGHSWLPMVVEGIMLGVDCVRIGMEDTVWMYPHRDEKIKNCADVIRKVGNIAKELGREIATPAEARKILGV